MQAKFETPTKARSAGHTPKPFIVGNDVSIAHAIEELNIGSQPTFRTPSKRPCCEKNGVNGVHDLYPCSASKNSQQLANSGFKHPIFDLAHSPYENFPGSSALRDHRLTQLHRAGGLNLDPGDENLGIITQPNSRLDHHVLMESESKIGHTDPFVIGSKPTTVEFSSRKTHGGYESLSSNDGSSDNSAKFLKSPAGVPLPISPARFANEAGNAISGENAQSFYTPESCIFVANLPMVYSDNQLQTEIRSLYGAFGECYVKVRRDLQGMPYAFVQYTKPSSARVAVEKGGNLLVGGRSCRVEPAKVPRTVFLFRVDGNAISIEQANGLLCAFGPVQKAWMPSDTEQEMFGLPNGVFIRFMYYDHCQEALDKMRADKTYHLQRKEDIAKIFSPRSSVRNTQGEHSPAQHGTNAIWIGSIQGDWASAQVLRNFYGRRVGPVSGAFVGAGSFGEKQSKYALVWFHDKNSVFKAVDCDTSELNAFNGGVPLRVQRKKSKPQTPERRFGTFKASPDGKFIHSPYNGGPVNNPMFISPNITPEQARNFAYVHPMFPGVHPAYSTMQGHGLPYPSFNGHFPMQQTGMSNGYPLNTFSGLDGNPAANGFQDGFEALPMSRPEPVPLHGGYLDRQY